MGRTLVWIVLALALGGVGWIVLGNPGADEGGGAYVDPELGALPDGQDDQPGLKGTGGAARASTQGGPRRYAIHGRVVDDAGHGVGDVPVLARYEGKAHDPNDPSSWSRTIDETIRGVIDRVTRSEEERWPERARARTDGEGRFELPLAEAGRYRVIAEPAAPSVAAYQSVSVRPGEERAETTLTLMAGAALEGTIVDGEDKPLRATLRASHYGMVENVYRAWTSAPVASDPASGSWRFDAVPRGTVRLSVELPSGRRITGISVEVPHAGPFTIRLPGGQAAIAGTVADGAGTPVADALVALSVSWREADGKVAGSVQLHARSDAQGAFAFADVPAGTVSRVEAVAPGFLPYRVRPGREGHEEIAVAAEGSTTVPIVLERGGTVTGRLTEAEGGAPIAGATVQLHRRRRMSEAVPYAIPPATTDADGRYRIDGVAQGSYVALPEAQGYFLPQLAQGGGGMAVPMGAEGNGAPPELTVVMTAEGKEIERDLVLGRGYDVRGTVRDGKGEPIAGAAIHANGYSLSQVGWQWGIGGRSEQPLATSGSDGRFTAHGMPPRPAWVLYAKKEGLVGKHAEPFALGADATPKELVLKLEQGATLRGRLEGLDGPALAEAQVGFWGTNQQLAFKSHGFKPAQDGTFEIPGVPAGDWTINAWANGRQAPQKTVSDVKPGEVREGIVLTFFEGAEVTGRIVDSKGQPVARLNVMLQVRAGTWTQTTTDSDGNFRFANVAKGSAQVMTWDDSGRQASIGKRFEAPASGVELVYDKPPTVILRGEVKAADGTPIAVCSVSARASGGQQPGMPVMVNPNEGGRDAINGRFEITTSGEGPWVVTASNARGEDGARLNLKQAQLVVRDASAPISLSMEAGGRVEGRVVDAKGKGVAGVQVMAGSGPRQTPGRTDKAGRFVLEGLDDGMIVVQVQPPAGMVRPRGQSVRAGRTDLEFRLVAGVTIQGTAFGPDGKPLTQGYASAQWSEQGEHAAGSTGTQIRGAGTFTLEGLPAGVRAKVQVQVWSASGKVAYAPAVLEDVLAGTSGLEVRLGDGLTIQGRVLDADGKAPAQCYIYGRTEDGTKQTGWVQVGEDGSFELGGLEAVAYELRVNRQDGGAAPPPLKVVPPRSGIEIRLPRTVAFGGRIQGLGQESGQGWRIRVYTADGKQIASARAQADGSWEIPAIAELAEVYVGATNRRDDRYGRAGPVKSSAEGVVLRLAQGKRITGTVDGAIRDGRVQAVIYAEGADGWLSRGVIEQDGSFVVYGVPEGTYTVKAQQYGSNGKKGEVGGVQAGASGVAIDLR